jgi:hypothetical protein
LSNSAGVFLLVCNLGLFLLQVSLGTGADPHLHHLPSHYLPDNRQIIVAGAGEAADATRAPRRFRFKRIGSETEGFVSLYRFEAKQKILDAKRKGNKEKRSGKRKRNKAKQRETKKKPSEIVTNRNRKIK